MTEQQNLIKIICEESYKPLKEASLKGSEEYHSYLIDCETLKDFDEITVCEDIRHKPMFDELLNFKCPVLYWFEILNPELNKKIVNAIGKYKRRGGRKATPTMRKTPYLDTNILYVGKVKKGFTGRVITHLGYYKITRTQGLQLYHWSTELELKLKLHVYTFKPELGPLMTVIERGVAEKLRPLLGTHK